MGFFRPTKYAQKFQGKFQSIFREKIRASKKIFRANFVLQTWHPNQMPHLHASATDWVVFTVDIHLSLKRDAIRERGLFR